MSDSQQVSHLGCYGTVGRLYAQLTAYGMILVMLQGFGQRRDIVLNYDILPIHYIYIILAMRLRLKVVFFCFPGL